MLWVASAALALSSCAKQAAPAKSAVVAAPGASAAAPLANAPILVSSTQNGSQGSASAAQARVPVTADDASWGDPNAPVTIVEFSDFQCPFCSRVVPTLERIEAEYGARVRFVFKHNPLPFHNRARPAANAARVVFALGGSAAFRKFHNLVFTHQQDLSDEKLEEFAAQAGIDGTRYKALLAAGTESKKVDDDIALAARIGANGTPGFRINGVVVSGAQPFDKFKEVIDAELVEVQKVLAQGTRPEDVYAARTNMNQAAAEEQAKRVAKDDDEDDEDEAVVWKVPVAADDPVSGPADAPVTLVIFSDYQCPFCKRVEETLKQVRSEYGNKIRFVWKDNPLPFHPRARPAAAMARLAYLRKGNAAFWKLHDALFESAPKLEDEDLQTLAADAGLDWKAVKAAFDDKKIAERLDASTDVAAEFQARGTPHFFVNGVRLSGAQPFENFKKLIDERLVAAEALLKQGTPRARIYEAVTKEGKLPPPPEKREVASRPNAPFRGAANAKVVIQEFADFQCPFCARVEPTLAALEKEFPGRIKFVYRHLPLPFHKDAPLAAEATEEAFVQKGNTGFWAFHDALYEAQGEDGIARPELEKIAAKLGLNLAHFREALDSRKHEPRIKADQDAGDEAKVNGTPAFFINQYFLSGAQPLPAFRKLVKRALADAGAK